QTVLAVAKKLLGSDVLNVLDDIAREVYNNGALKIFPYKTLRETINLVMVTLLRELLAYQKVDLPVPFTRDVQIFVKGLYLSGQTELAGHQQQQVVAGQVEGGEISTGAAQPTVNIFRLTVQANAACVDLLVWATADESG
ncbi:unnamed protein product, partial [Meganyctiphanes norvegica]